MVGANIGGGEWLFGPLVTAQYGGTVLWLATLAIIVQVAYDLSVMRYTLLYGRNHICRTFSGFPPVCRSGRCSISSSRLVVFGHICGERRRPLASVFLGRLPAVSDAALVKG